jgi:phage I-like protein
MKELLKLLGLTDDATEASAIAAVNKLLADARIVANKTILAELALNPDATETEVRSAIMTLKTGTAFVANKAVFEALGLQETAGESEIVGTILAMKQAHSSIDALTQENNKLKDEISKSTAEELVTAAMKAGKITPAQKPWAIDSARRDPEGFKVFVSKAPVVVRLDKIADDEAAGDHIDETQAAMNTLLGVTNESWKKHHKKPA